MKSLVFTIDGAPVIALVSGANQLDERRLAAPKREEPRAGAPRRISCDRQRDTPSAASRPFGHAQLLPVYVDRDLLDYDEVWAAAGTWNDVFPIDPEVLGARRPARRSPTSGTREERGGPVGALGRVSPTR